MSAAQVWNNESPTDTATATQAAFEDAQKKNMDRAILAWQEADRTLARAKETEKTMREAVIAMAFPSNEPLRSGTENRDLGMGYKLKAVFKVNYNVAQTAVEDALDKLEAFSPEGKFVADRVIKWKADLSLTEYKTLEPAMKAIIDTVLTLTPGLPSLEVVEPKAKK